MAQAKALLPSKTDSGVVGDFGALSGPGGCPGRRRDQKEIGN